MSPLLKHLYADLVLVADQSQTYVGVCNLEVKSPRLSPRGVCVTPEMIVVLLNRLADVTRRYVGIANDKSSSSCMSAVRKLGVPLLRGYLERPEGVLKKSGRSHEEVKTIERPKDNLNREGE